jgi:hypothetical protein
MHFPNWRLVHVDEGLVSSPETILWMIQWCALVVMGASWDTSATAISASPPSSCEAFRRTMWLLWWSLSTGRCRWQLRRVGWRDTSNRPDERGGQEHQPGGKNIVSELVEAVCSVCQKSWITCFVLAAAVVSNRRGCGAELQALVFWGGALARPQGLGHRRHRLSDMFSKASSSSAFSFLVLCGFLVEGGRCSVKNNGFVKFTNNGIQVSSHYHSD